MANENDLVASIDIGTSKVVVLIAEPEDGVMRVLGHGVCDSEGVKRGSITDPNLVARAIKRAAKRAYKNFKSDIINVSVNISDPHLTVVNREGHISVSGNRVTRDDVELAIKTASATPTPANKQVLESCCIPNRFAIDSNEDMIVVDKPVGLEAKVLGAQMHIVSVSNQSIGNIQKSIEKSGFGLNQIILDSMSNSEVFVSQDEKDNGVCVVDIGAGVTNYSVFTNGGITYSDIVQIAGNDVTQNIAYSFDTSFDEAERLKKEYGRAQIKHSIKDRLVRFEQTNSTEDKYLSNYSLIEVIGTSLDQLFNTIKKNIKAQKLDRSIKSGFILTGGSSLLPGFEELFRNSFKIRTKLVVLYNNKIKGQEVIITNPMYSSAMGLVLYYDEEIYFDETILEPETNILGIFKEKLLNF
jgi:cell division protein FtsA